MSRRLACQPPLAIVLPSELLFCQSALPLLLTYVQIKASYTIPDIQFSTVVLGPTGLVSRQLS